MMQALQLSLRDRLLEDWQREFPLVSRPFEVIAKVLGTSERTVIDTLEELRSGGTISRVGGVVRPNTLGSSTLAAMAVPDLQIDTTAALLRDIPGVNHIYLRENALNLWFVVTGPDRAYVDRTLDRIRDDTAYAVLDLRLEQSYHIDLGFTLSGGDRQKASRQQSNDIRHTTYEARPIDRALAQALSEGLPLVPEPFARLGESLQCSVEEIIERLGVLVGTGIVPRIGVIVRHRALGWRSNAMVVWDIPAAGVDRIGAILARAPGLNLCYRRTRYEKDWPYNLYCMIHAKSRENALDRLQAAEALAEIQGQRRQILFSLRCFKQTGALLAQPKEAA